MFSWNDRAYAIWSGENMKTDPKTQWRTIPADRRANLNTGMEKRTVEYMESSWDPSESSASLNPHVFCAIHDGCYNSKFLARLCFLKYLRRKFQTWQGVPPAQQSACRELCHTDNPNLWYSFWTILSLSPIDTQTNDTMKQLVQQPEAAYCTCASQRLVKMWLLLVELAGCAAFVQQHRRRTQGRWRLSI